MTMTATYSTNNTKSLPQVMTEFWYAGTKCSAEDTPEPIKEVTGIFRNLLGAVFAVVEDKEENNKIPAKAFTDLEREEHNAQQTVSRLKGDPRLKNAQSKSILDQARSALRNLISHPEVIDAKNNAYRINCDFNTISPPEEVDKIVSTYKDGNYREAFSMVAELKHLDEATQDEQSTLVIQALKDGEQWAKDFSQIIKKEKDMKEIARLRRLPEDVKDKQIEAKIKALRENRQSAREFLKTARNAKTYTLQKEEPRQKEFPPSSEWTLDAA